MPPCRNMQATFGVSDVDSRFSSQASTGRGSKVPLGTNRYPLAPDFQSEINSLDVIIIAADQEGVGETINFKQKTTDFYLKFFIRSG